MVRENKTSLTEYVKGHIWLKEYPIRYAGVHFSARMTVIRLSDGRLMIHSPCEIDEATKSEIDAIGEAAYIVAPGNYHHIHVASCQRAFPGAETWICPGIERKRPGIHFDWILGDRPDPKWEADLDQVLVRGNFIICEVAFFHRASKTLLLVDLIENIGDKTPGISWFLKFWWVVFRMWNRPKPAPEYQLGWKSRAAAKRSLERILAWEFDRIIIAHGDLIETNAQHAAATAWKAILGCRA